ncbi:hypothetical protein MMC09_004205 [Bachmanniomyces sp. S44760]|nr:hypothetical protein [Bachmanniomyces sp. S44760]
MTPRLHYVTPDGLPPNGGVPPNVNPQYMNPARPPPPPVFHNPVPAVAFHGVPTVPRPDFGFVPLDHPTWLPLQPASPAPPAQVSISRAPQGPPGAKFKGTALNIEGKSYLFPGKHTTIHFVLDGFQPWKAPHRQFSFSAHEVPTLMTIDELIRQLGISEDRAEKRGIAELIEKGDGIWQQGGSFLLGEKRSSQTLGSLGWNESRGKERKPTWVCLYTG